MRWMFAFFLCCSSALAQQAPTPQQIINERESIQIGALIKQNINLGVQLEAANEALAKANAKIKELEAKVTK